MKVRAATVVLVFLVIAAGCVSRINVDYLALVRVKADVFDQQTGEPLHGATIRCIRTAQGEEEIVGTTDVSGHIDTSFEYFWGKSIQSWREESEGNSQFQIRVVKDGYDSATLSYRLNTLPTDGVYSVVEVGRLSLTRVADTSDN